MSIMAVSPIPQTCSKKKTLPLKERGKKNRKERWEGLERFLKPTNFNHQIPRIIHEIKR